MKKVLSVMALGAALASTTYADIARVEAGAGAWMQTPTGSAIYNGTTTGVAGGDTLKQDQKTQSYAWILVKHPIPVIPNLRLEYSTIEAKGNPTAYWGNYSYTGGTSKLDVTQYDIIPYYNLLDNTFWMTVDVGLDVKLLDAKYTATAAGVPNYEYNKQIPIPMGYVRGRVEIPMTGFGVEADAKYVQYSGSTFYDVRAKVDYTFDMFPIVQPAIEVGYREEKVKIDASAVDIKTDIKFAGVYVGAMLRF